MVWGGGVLCNHHGMKETGTFSICKLWQNNRIESELSHNSAQKKGEHRAATLKQNPELVEMSYTYQIFSCLHPVPGSSRVRPDRAALKRTENCF